MTNGVSNLAADENYAISVANNSFDWYRSRAILTRRAHRFSEVIFLVVSASISVSAVLRPSSAVLPAILGAFAIILAGMRSVFHWEENYLRFTVAREAVEAERRQYLTKGSPYDEAATRDQVLVAAITRIEQTEMARWVKVAGVRRQQ